MDPAFRHTMVLFLQDLAARHRAVTPAEETVDLAVNACLAGDAPDGWTADHVLGLIVAAFAPAEKGTPHRVHQAGAIAKLAIDADDQPTDPKAKGARITGTRYAGALACPDCGRGLASRDDGGMLCPTLASAAVMASCHPGCIVACGVTPEDLTDG